MPKKKGSKTLAKTSVSKQVNPPSNTTPLPPSTTFASLLAQLSPEHQRILEDRFGTDTTANEKALDTHSDCPISGCHCQDLAEPRTITIGVLHKDGRFVSVSGLPRPPENLLEEFIERSPMYAVPESGALVGAAPDGELLLSIPRGAALDALKKFNRGAKEEEEARAGGERGDGEQEDSQRVAHRQQLGPTTLRAELAHALADYLEESPPVVGALEVDLLETSQPTEVPVSVARGASAASKGKSTKTFASHDGRTKGDHRVATEEEQAADTFSAEAPSASYSIAEDTASKRPASPKANLNTFEWLEKQLGGVEEARQRLETTMQASSNYLAEYKTQVEKIFEDLPPGGREEKTVSQDQLKELLAEANTTSPEHGITRLTAQTVELKRIEYQLTLLVRKVAIDWRKTEGGTKKLDSGFLDKDMNAILYAVGTGLRLHVGFENKLYADQKTHDDILAHYKDCLGRMILVKPSLWERAHGMSSSR